MGHSLMGNKRNSCCEESSSTEVEGHYDHPRPVKMYKNCTVIQDNAVTMATLPDLVKDTMCPMLVGRVPAATQLPCVGGPIPLRGPRPCFRDITQPTTNLNNASRPNNNLHNHLYNNTTEMTALQRLDNNPCHVTHTTTSTATPMRLDHIGLLGLRVELPPQGQCKTTSWDMRIGDECGGLGALELPQSLGQRLSNICTQDHSHSGSSFSSDSSGSSGILGEEPAYENVKNCQQIARKNNLHDLIYTSTTPSPRCVEVDKILWAGRCHTKDLAGLRINYIDLLACGFYHGSMCMSEAKKKLKKTYTGTFLIRDSSDPKHLYSLSVKTERGTTSVRIVYESGKFRLDCDTNSLDQMPTFPRIVQLIEHYVREGKLGAGTANSPETTNNTSRKPSIKKCVWLESTGRKDTPVHLRKPCANSVQSLKHLCRIAVNKVCYSNDVTRNQNHKNSPQPQPSLDLLEARMKHLPSLPDPLKQYMSQYTFRI